MTNHVQYSLAAQSNAMNWTTGLVASPVSERISKRVGRYWILRFLKLTSNHNGAMEAQASNLCPHERRKPSILERLFIPGSGGFSLPRANFDQQLFPVNAAPDFGLWFSVRHW
jgi:hypothetical protein